MGLNHYGSTITAVALTLGLAGCSFTDVPAAKSTTGRPPLVAEVPDADETVRGVEEPAIVTLEMGSRLKERRLARSEELPGNIVVPNTNLNAVPVTTALQAVLAGTDVSLSWDSGSFDSRLVTVTNLSGALPRVVEKICTSAKVFCSHRNGLLEIKEKETFVIDMPAWPTKSSTSSGGGSGAATNSMAEAITELAGGGNVKIDQHGGNLIYTTDVEGNERVREYLEQLRNGRPLVVLQLYIWEVTLNKENAVGINWTNFKFDTIGGKMESLLLGGSTAFTSITSPGVSLGATFKGHVDADTILQFLSTQGQVQTISNPQLTFISGSNAEFRVGGKQRYISQVGQLTNANTTGAGTTNSGIGTNTVSTDEIETGLKVEAGGSFEGGVISAILELTTQDLVSLNPTSTSSDPDTPGTTIDLPETSERKVSTTLRVRPGDNLVLAGLVSSRDTNDREGIPLPFGGRVPTKLNDQLKNSELVVLVKPSVVLFSDKVAESEEKWKERKEKAKQTGLSESQDAVVIDKDGARTLKLPPGFQPPSTNPQPMLPPMAFPTQPELMMPAPETAPLGNVPVPPSEDGAPVDRRLMQRGFSHAFDELLTPSSDSSAPISLRKGGGAQ